MQTLYFCPVVSSFFFFFFSSPNLSVFVLFLIIFWVIFLLLKTVVFCREFSGGSCVWQLVSQACHASEVDCHCHNCRVIVHCEMYRIFWVLTHWIITLLALAGARIHRHIDTSLITLCTWRNLLTARELLSFLCICLSVAKWRGWGSRPWHCQFWQEKILRSTL